ncbi:hypothetical protein BRPE67_ECDS02730 (plasmid) [Caballeronia cordobensis]|nr:hypothetical protein BRPE67_ECDS02730 [Burkholderia sp. RPE67]
MKATGSEANARWRRTCNHEMARSTAYRIPHKKINEAKGMA